MNKFWPLALLLAAAFFLPLAGRAEEPFGPDPPVVRPGPPRIATNPDRWLPWRVFTWRDGVKIASPPLAADPQGYLWADGPVRYDGKSWQPLKVPGESVPEQIWSLLAASDGSLWLGRTVGGLRRLRGGVWTWYPPGVDIPSGPVSALAEEDGRTIWVGTGRGLARCRDGRCAETKLLRGSSVRSLVVTRAAAGGPALWIGTDRGLLRLEGIDGASPTLSRRFADPAVLPSLSIRSLAETTSAEGVSLWVGTDLGLARLRRGVWTRYDERVGFPGAAITAIAASRALDGRPVVWAGSFRRGLFRFEEDGRWALFDTRSGLPADYIYNLLVTRGGTGGEPTLWVSTPGGLARLERERWAAVDSRSGLPNDIVVGLGEATFPDGLHTDWIGTTGGMVRRTPRGWEAYSPFATAPELVFATASARQADGSAEFWVGSVNDLHRFAHGRWSTFNSRSSPLPHDWLLSLLARPTPQGTEIWVGTLRGGLLRYAQGRWTVFRAGSSGFPGDEVRSLLATSRRTGSPVLWAGTDHGVGRFTGEGWEKAEVPCLPDPKVLALHPALGPDGGGWLWIGTQAGIARLRIDNEGRPLTAPQDCQALTAKQLPHPYVIQIETDAWGRVYLFTDAGVSRLTLAAGSLATAGIETFDAGDGLPGMEINHAGFTDGLGRIWAGANGGAAVLDPAPPRAAATQPAPLRLERILVAGRERSLAPGTALRYDENSVDFQYALLSFQREQATRYRTQLVGLEDHPTAWTAETRAVYNRLPRGEYTFRVWGRDSEGVVAGPLAVRFRVRPAPWLSGWTIALYALALIALGYGASQIRTLSRRAATLETEVTERTRELAEANRRLEVASLTDPLTGLSNRRFLSLNIEPDVRQAVRNALGTAAPRERNGDLIFYFLDVDHFKALNDRHGHAAGDRVLVELAGRLREAARDTDAVLRWGGEEFLIVSRWADRQAGAALAARLLAAVAGTPFDAAPDHRVEVTCSVGWAPYPWRPEVPNAVHYEQVLSLADRALYMAKREGRNRAVGLLPGTDDERFPEGPFDEQDGALLQMVRTPGPTKDDPLRAETAVSVAP